MPPKAAALNRKNDHGPADPSARSGETADKLVEADFAFHQSIAAASGNPRFVEIMTMFGADLRPCSRVGDAISVELVYLSALDAEHVVLVREIQNRDADAASRATRKHLTNSQRRYRAMQIVGIG